MYGPVHFSGASTTPSSDTFTVRELGIGFVAYSPLGRGFLAGGIRSLDELPANDWRRNDPRWSEENFADNLKIVDTVRAVEAADLEAAVARDEPIRRTEPSAG